MGFIAGALALGACVAFLGTAGDTDDGRGSSSAAVRMCQSAVTDQLRSPTSASFPPTREHRTRESRDGWHVSGYVDADNAFGANIRTHWNCTASRAEGGNWSTRVNIED